MFRLARVGTIITIMLIIGAAVAIAAPEFEAKIKVSGGGTYDYCVIGMNSHATDGFDNAYDSLAPGGNMNDTYITCTIPHPEWGAVKGDFRGDYRSPKRSDTWDIVIRTNLPAETPLTMEVQQKSERQQKDAHRKKDTVRQKNMTISAEGPAAGQHAVLTNAPYQFTVTGEIMNFTITAGNVKKAPVGQPTLGNGSLFRK